MDFLVRNVYSSLSIICLKLFEYKTYYSDSIFMALTKPIDDIILPQFRDEWFEKIRHQWFVTDENDINQTRYPGEYE